MVAGETTWTHVEAAVAMTVPALGVLLNDFFATTRTCLRAPFIKLRDTILAGGTTEITTRDASVPHRAQAVGNQKDFAMGWYRMAQQQCCCPRCLAAAYQGCDHLGDFTARVGNRQENIAPGAMLTV